MVRCRLDRGISQIARCVCVTINVNYALLRPCCHLIAAGWRSQSVAVSLGVTLTGGVPLRVPTQTSDERVLSSSPPDASGRGDSLQSCGCRHSASLERSVRNHRSTAPKNEAAAPITSLSNTSSRTSITFTPCRTHRTKRRCAISFAACPVRQPPWPGVAATVRWKS